MAEEKYTSYETSLALRDAGAPQLGRTPFPFSTMHWNSEDGQKPWLGQWIGDRYSVRAFRADEIIEAIRADGIHAVDIEDDDEWGVRVWRDGTCPKLHEHQSLVEALAQAWLAVLKETPRVPYLTAVRQLRAAIARAEGRRA